jgi:hypothetical protein
MQSLLKLSFSGYNGNIVLLLPLGVCSRFIPLPPLLGQGDNHLDINKRLGPIFILPALFRLIKPGEIFLPLPHTAHMQILPHDTLKHLGVDLHVERRDEEFGVVSRVQVEGAFECVLDLCGEVLAPFLAQFLEVVADRLLL